MRYTYLKEQVSLQENHYLTTNLKDKK